MPCQLGRCLGAWAAVLLSYLAVALNTSELLSVLLQLFLLLLLLLLLSSEALLRSAPAGLAEADAGVSGPEVTCSEGES